LAAGFEAQEIKRLEAAKSGRRGRTILMTLNSGKVRGGVGKAALSHSTETKGNYRRIPRNAT
jgi:hypothetical protein